MPWWGWLIAGIILLNVMNSSGNSFVPVVIFAMIALSAFNRSKRDKQPWVGGTPAPPQGQPYPVDRDPGQPQDDVSSGPLPTIDVPQYPGAAAPTGAGSGHGATTGTPGVGPSSYSAPGQGTGGDPVVSLAQLHLSRLGRELHEAASRAAMVDVTRLLTEIGDLAARMTTMVAGTHGLPGSGRKEFESGLRRLEREVTAAQSETSPGPKVSRVVQTCTSMGQTGRHE